MLGSEVGVESREQWEPVRSDAGSVRAESASRDLLGEYRCVADNGVGPPLHKHVRVAVHGEPRLSTPAAGC